MASWQGSLWATTAQYQKELADGISRKNVFVAMLTEKGHIAVNAGQGGEGFKWNVEVTYPRSQNLEDGQQLTRTRKNVLEQASLDWAYYENANVLTERDFLKNRGQAQMTDLLKTTVDNTMKGLRRDIGADMYLDGNTTSLRFHGLETFGGYGSAQGTTGVFAPSDTYAGISTVLGTLGGTAPSTSWPDGDDSATPEYSAWSPLILSSTSTAFGAAATWAANCQEVLSKASAYTDVMDGSVETVVMGPAYWHSLARSLEARDRTVTDASDKVKKYGFKAINYYGMDCVSDRMCPAARAYGINWEAMEMLSLFDKLFPATEKDKFFIDKSTTINSRCFAQVKFVNPRNFFIVKELGS